IIFKEDVRIMDLKDLHKNAENIWKKLRLRTHILAIKISIKLK
ncbi:unnamed protein product, partial [marine sediment metagenome]